MIVSTAPEKRRKDLSDRDEHFVKAFFECNGDFVCVAEKVGIQTAEEVKRVGKSPKIQHEIMRQLKHRTNVVAKVDMRRFDVSKDDRMELLWEIAQGGAERIIDKEGNAVFMNPAVSVSAIRTLNEMIPGSIAPTQVEVTHKRETRNEAQVLADIRALQSEINDLALEGEYTASISDSSHGSVSDTSISDTPTPTSTPPIDPKVAISDLEEDVIELTGVTEADINKQIRLPKCDADGTDFALDGKTKYVNT